MNHDCQTKKIKIGVFGAGRGMTMINGLLNNPDAELAAICDYYAPFEKRVKKINKQTGTKISFYHDFDKFMNHDMDAVVLANYASEHAPMPSGFSIQDATSCSRQGFGSLHPPRGARHSRVGLPESR